MPDVFTKAKRSEVMSQIRGRGNKDTELVLAKLFRQHDITGWRRQRVIHLPTTKRRAGPARPTNVQTDFVFFKHRVAVFVDGCFWHACPKHCTYAKWLRKSNVAERERTTRSFVKLRMTTGKDFWKKKLIDNQARDRLVNRMLRRVGWRVIRVWEHELTGNPPGCIERIASLLKANR